MERGKGDGYVLSVLSDICCRHATRHDEDSVLRGYGAGSRCNHFPTFRDKVVVSSSRVPEERHPQLHCSENLNDSSVFFSLL
jgi:hypothetical protein